MGLAGRAAAGTLGVFRGGPLGSLWSLMLLFLTLLELNAQMETKPMYIWQTGNDPHHLLVHSYELS